MAKSKTIIIVGIIAIVIIALIIFFLVREPGPEEPVITEEIYGLSGEITEIDNNTLLIEANILLADLLQEPIKKTVKVLVNNETSIFSLKFPENIPEGSDQPIIPEEKEVRLSDLSIGDKIDIETISNVSENVKNKTEIVAKSINVIK
jgi:hypothetical protein